MQYATISDLTIRYDVRRLGDLVSDTGTRVTPLDNNAILTQMLVDASGMIDAACQRGQKYTPLDLKNIFNGADPLNPTIDLTGSQALLKRLCSDLAYGLLVGRRGYGAADNDAQSPRYKEALAALELIKQGEWVFVTAGALAAGVPVSGIVISQNISLISGIRRYFGDLHLTPNSYPNVGQ